VGKTIGCGGKQPGADRGKNKELLENACWKKESGLKTE